MARRQNDIAPARFASLILLLMGLISLTIVYIFLSRVLTPTKDFPSSSDEIISSSNFVALPEQNVGGCCRGIPNLELWGAAMKWGNDFKVNSSEECCNACKAMCSRDDGPCLCDSWVFCGNKKACGSQFGECWLKKQNDTLVPERQQSGPLFNGLQGSSLAKESVHILLSAQGIIGLETEYGTLRVKLFPECAPQSIDHILEVLALKRCVGCHFYRAESRGQFWDSEGNHVVNAPFGPPFALIQGTLAAQEASIPNIPTEACLPVKRGSVAWVGSGPEFFISLANHEEWKNEYTVFGSVLPEDMGIAERIAQLPTAKDVWNNVEVSVLENPVPLHLRRRRKISQGDGNRVE